MSLTDVEGAVLDRLAIYHREISGVVAVTTHPPSTPLDDGELPFVYHLVGGMTDSLPTASTGPGSVVVSRLYSVRLLVATYRNDMDVSQVGALANELAKPFYARFRNKYLTYPLLSTEGTYEDALDELPLVFPVEFRDTGLTTRIGPGGLDYATIEWQLTIAYRLILPDSSPLY